MLQIGQKFPELAMGAVGGGNITLPQDLAGGFGVVIIYRGAWCPLCRDQLAEYAAAKAKLDELGVKVVAVSSDDEATTAGLVEKLQLNFPVGHSANVSQVSAALGAYTNAEPLYLQPTAIVLTPEGSIRNVVYSNSAVGRLTAAEVIRTITFARSQAKVA
jgi:peroxiredoxin